MRIKVELMVLNLSMKKEIQQKNLTQKVDKDDIQLVIQTN